jgi:membrane-associated phospholipid phosphatase
MKYIFVQIALIIALCESTGFAASPPHDQGRLLPPNSMDVSAPAGLSLFSNLGDNLYHSFIGCNTLLHLGAAATTIIMVDQDWDYLIYKRAESYRRYRSYFTPVVYSGATLWLVISAPLLVYGYVHKSDDALGAAFAVLQSTLISITYTTILKGLTGRPGPEAKWYEDVRERSRVFRFGFLRGGVFNGWPGGHTIITTATLAALMSYYPDQWWIKIIGFAVIAYTAVGMTMTRAHWMSDNIAGFLMGYAIGSTVGRSFRSLVNRRLGIGGSNVELSPLFSENGAGLSFTFSY